MAPWARRPGWHVAGSAFIVQHGQETPGINRTLLNGIVSSLDEKAYLVTTGYNRHKVRLARD